ncbi:tRNA (adenosine(37)-N6)-threonylcarbamoyltransferase complex transferase subunit TsaD [Candidatus Nomurabacteria bacterium]|nr:tRNA (adenosine(37)-N6)-threonylcarbamoyltransferase complex transferase subunit TsaD [Candidatus Nomurabacteria bacterium]
MIILGIETSCDETAISLIEVVDEDKSSFKILSHQVLSQIKIHEKYGGVFPALAKREHAKNIVPLFKIALKEAELLVESKNINNFDETKIETNLKKEAEMFVELKQMINSIDKPKIDLITVTSGPGLEPALWVGLNFAKAISEIWSIPLIPVNHMEGHIMASLIEKDGETNKFVNAKFPAIALLISGGHTELVYIKNNLKYEIVGQTKDDAVGEAFDKVARILGLPYPGGPQISKLAQEEINSGSIERPFILPRPMIKSKDFDFSFSGLKTAVLYTVKKIPELTEKIKKQIAKEFEDSVIDTLLFKTKGAILKYNAKTLIIGGGVIANKRLREHFFKLKDENPELTVLIPELHLSTDNATMIAIAGYINFIDKTPIKTIENLRAEGNLRLC